MVNNMKEGYYKIKGKYFSETEIIENRKLRELVEKRIKEIQIRIESFEHGIKKDSQIHKDLAREYRHRKEKLQELLERSKT